MLFHQPDKTFKRLASCYKRANKYAQQGDWSSHPLAAMFSNALLFLDASSKNDPEINEIQVKNNLAKIIDDEFVVNWAMSKVDSQLKFYLRNKENVKEVAFDLVIFDWVALKIDDYLKNHLIDGDAGLHAILYEWQKRIPIDPTKLKNA